MDLEAREQTGSDKTKYCNRVKSYEKEVQKLEQELVCSTYLLRGNFFQCHIFAMKRGEKLHISIKYLDYKYF